MHGSIERVIISKLIDPNVMQIISEWEAKELAQPPHFLLAAQPDAAAALLANL